MVACVILLTLIIVAVCMHVGSMQHMQRSLHSIRKSAKFGARLLEGAGAAKGNQSTHGSRATAVTSVSVKSTLSSPPANATQSGGGGDSKQPRNDSVSGMTDMNMNAEYDDYISVVPAPPAPTLSPKSST